MGGSGRRHPALAVDLGKVDRVAGLRAKLAQVLGLDTAVAFAKRVDVVHVAKNVTCGGREVLTAQAAEKIGRLKPPMNIGHAGFNEPAELELVAVLGDLDAADLARPFVDILEQMMVDGTQVRQVEMAGRRTFPQPLNHQPSFKNLKLGGIPDAGSVSQDITVWVKVGIVAHSAARRWNCARM